MFMSTEVTKKGKKKPQKPKNKKPPNLVMYETHSSANLYSRLGTFIKAKPWKVTFKV